MDLQFKGKIWVGNIYQKFEAMCQEVDDFVSQDTVKYVENQVQTVGESVKKFCSDVVQDFLPPLLDPVKCEAQMVPREQNDAIGTYWSMIGAEEEPDFVDTKQSSAEQAPVNPLKSHQAASLNELCPRKQCFTPPPADPIAEAQLDSSLRQDDDVLIYNNSDMSVEENVVKEEQSLPEDLSSLGDNCSSEASFFGESIGENHKNGILAKVCPATLVHGTGLISSQEEGAICNSFSDEVEFDPKVSSSLRSSELVFSTVSCENKVPDSALIFSSSSLSTGSHNPLEFSHESISHKVEKNCSNPANVGCVSDLSGALSSSESFPTVACDNKITDMGPAFSNSVLSLESNDVETSRTDEAVCVAGTSFNKHERGCECSQLEAFMSSLEIGQADHLFIDLADPSMETIDLSDKVKLDESCVIVDSKLLYTVSCRPRKLRSYKKIIKDAFASKKRLTKEYEQLAILYGDIDIKSSVHPEHNLLSSSATTSLESKESLTHDLCDSEWELL